MSRPTDFIAVLEDPTLPAISSDSPEGALVVHLLAHLFFADEQIDPGELRLLGRVMAGHDAEAVAARVRALAGEPVPYEALAAAFPDR